MRRITFLLAALGLGYLVLRFDSFTLSPTGCSPLLRFAPGDRLLLDRWATRYAPGDALLFRAPDGLLYLGLVDRLRSPGDPGEPALWVRTDNPECEGKGSEVFGWIDGDDCVARVVLEWPW